MVENLIAGYLSTGKRLVIPELGAFLKKDTGEVVFVEYLKKDDGVFNGIISQTLGIPLGEAARHAAELTGDVRDSLATKGFYIIPNLGTMRRDATGAITLSPSIQEETVITPPVQETKKPEVQQPKVVQYTHPQQQAKVEHYSRAQNPVDNAKKPQPAPPQPRPVASTPVAQVRQQEPEVKAIRQTQPTTSRQRPPVNVPHKKKRGDIIMIIAVIAALVAIGSMVYGLMVDNDPIMNIQPTSPQQEVVQEAVIPQE